PILGIAPANARTFSGDTRQTTAVTVSSNLSMSQPQEERSIASVEGLHQQRSVEVSVAPFARGFGDQTARMACCRVQRTVFAWIVFRAQRIRRADLRPIQCLPAQPTEVLGLAEID